MKRFDTWLGIVPDGLLVLTVEGEIVRANARATALLGLDVGDDLCAAVKAPEALRALLRACAETEQPVSATFELSASPPRTSLRGTVLAFAGAVVRPQVEPGQELVAATLRLEAAPTTLLRAVPDLEDEVQRLRHGDSEPPRDAEELREHALQLEAAARVHDQLLATVSHELRTPLNAILGWSVLLGSGTLSAASRERAIRTIERNARVQAQLVDDLLDASRMVRGALQIVPRDVDVRGVVTRAVRSVQSMIDGKRLQLDVMIADDVDVVWGDSERLEQVLRSLLSNSAKFTHEGGRIAVVLEHVAGALELTVSDTGIGIPQEFLPHVFDLFRQRDGSVTRRHGGLGLGLTIAKSLVSMHGGTIWAESDGEGRGTRMRIRLPSAKAQARRRSDAPRATASSEMAGMAMLVVDDEPDALELLTSVLEDHGAWVACSRSPHEALAMVPAVRPHALVSNIAMPEMDGPELIRRVRALGPERGGNVPAIAMSGSPEARAVALAAGFRAHLAKPVDPHALVCELTRLVGEDR